MKVYFAGFYEENSRLDFKRIISSNYFKHSACGDSCIYCF